MSQIDMQRMAAMMTFGEKYGMEPSLAAKAALALHPLDDSPVPSRTFEKQIRKESRQFAKALRKLPGQPGAAQELTLATLRSYKEQAIQAGESHYIERYDKALESDDV